jgi:hypothetical protein
MSIKKHALFSRFLLVVVDFLECRWISETPALFWEVLELWLRVFELFNG